MSQPIAIVTGSNRGLGKQIAIDLAKRGFVVVMACRNMRISAPVCKEIMTISGNNSVDLMELDLGSKRSIRQFEESFRKKYGRLNVLINNAGIISFSSGKTIDGLDKVVGINYFGPYLLTRQLIPLFVQGEDNRIINLTSMIYPCGRFKWDKINDYKWLKSYAVSKYAILLFTLELAEDLKDKGITANAIHPGVVRTTIFSRKKWYEWLINTFLRPLLTPVEEGAKPVIDLVVSDDLKGMSGLYFYKSSVKKVSKKLNNTETRRELMRKTEDLMTKEI